jgi:two-component system response regulator NreC
MQFVDELKPDLLITDLSMPRMSGVEAIKAIKKRSPKTKILVLTVHKNEEYIQATLQAGAEGYLLKDSSYAELVLAVEHVLSGRRYVSPGISDKIVAGYLEGRTPLNEGTAWDALTTREREILKLIAEGYKNKEIAKDLCISIKTVEKHRSNLMEKLDLHNVQALTAYAMKKGLISSED